MAAVTGLTVVKSFTYRDVPGEEFANTYHFKGPPPGDDASWLVLLNDVVAQERTCYPAAVSWVRSYGYDSDDPAANHVFFHDFNQPGPPPTGSLTAPAGGTLMAGDQAAFMQWGTDGKSTRGKRIYLRKFLHHGYVQSTDPDRLVVAGYHTVLTAAAAALGALHGGMRSRAHDVNVQNSGVGQWVTTRTLKHRGKRGGPA